MIYNHSWLWKWFLIWSSLCFNLMVKKSILDSISFLMLDPTSRKYFSQKSNCFRLWLKNKPTNSQQNILFPNWKFQFLFPISFLPGKSTFNRKKKLGDVATFIGKFYPLLWLGRDSYIIIWTSMYVFLILKMGTLWQTYRYKKIRASWYSYLYIFFCF